MSDNIQTSKHVTHYCRLQACGSIEHRCKEQCSGCMEKEKAETKNFEFDQTVKRVGEINSRLRSKHFDVYQIDAFWSKLIALIPTIKQVGVENIKVCTGCGHLEIELPYLSCCPDSNYVKINMQ